MRRLILLTLATALAGAARAEPGYDYPPEPPVEPLPPIVATIDPVGHPAPLDPAIATMVAKAAQSEDPAVFAAVVAVAKQTAPDYRDAIDAVAASATSRRDIARIDEVVRTLAPAVAPRPPRPHWRGQVELGGSRATGSATALGAYTAIDAAFIDEAWSHRLTARGDYQQTDGDPTTERLVLAYQPQLRLDPRYYVYALGQYEHDRFAGYRNRYTAGAGAGLSLARGPQFNLAVEAGPAIRRTDYYLRPNEDTLAARGSLNLNWLVSPNITLVQEMAVYGERNRASAKSLTAVDTHLFGPLKARFSYNLQYERDDADRRSILDTVTRASLLYGF